MWNAKIITSCPEMFPGVLGFSVIGAALKKKKWCLDIINLHDFGFDERRSIDDKPFGGGPGMIIRPDVVEKAVIQTIENTEKKNSINLYESCWKTANSKRFG